MLLMYNSFLSALTFAALLLSSSSNGTLASGFSHPIGRQQQQQQQQHAFAPCKLHAPTSTITTTGSSSISSTTSRWTQLSVPRGGGVGGVVKKATSSSSSAENAECPVTGAATVFTSLWGTFGVVYILAKAIKRVLPIAMEPFQKASGSVALSQFELG
jgi:hypothetical protein